jgi:aminopeptidase N
VNTTTPTCTPTQGEPVPGTNLTREEAAARAALVTVDSNEVELDVTTLDPAAHYADSRITLPGLAADNVVVITATGRYTNTGEGLHRFVDPVDDEVYLYSQFEVPDSRRMFPVFEQPDLKAAFTFTVTAPAHWQVVSNSPTPTPKPVREGVATWRLPPPRASPATSPRSSPGPMTSCATPRDQPPPARCRSASSAASR